MQRSRIYYRLIYHMSLAGALFILAGCSSHFLVYRTATVDMAPVEIQLQTRFDSGFPYFYVESLSHFVTPAEKTHDGRTYRIRHEDHHFTWYALRDTNETERTFLVRNQFGNRQIITTGNPKFLLTPSGKRTSHGHYFEIPDDISHYKVYEVVSSRNFEFDRVHVSDQFTRRLNTTVKQPRYYGMAVSKAHDSLMSLRRGRDRDIVFYEIDAPEQRPVDPVVRVTDQFRCDTLDFLKRMYLGVQSTSKETDPSPGDLGHFLVYDIVDQSEVANAELRDGSHPDIIPVSTMHLTHFATPVEKIHHGETSEILNEAHHAKWYELQPGASSFQSIAVTNQFGEYELTVGDYQYLMVPAGKELKTGDRWAIPADLSHYLIYRINAYVPRPTPGSVTLNDQFTSGLVANITKPMYYGVPVAKTHEGQTYEITHAGYALVFYEFETENDIQIPSRVDSEDQFGRHSIDFVDRSYLGVPSSPSY